MSFPRDIQDIILCYTGDDRLIHLSKNKKKVAFYNKIQNVRTKLEKKFIRYQHSFHENNQGDYSYTYIINSGSFIQISKEYHVDSHNVTYYPSYTGVMRKGLMLQASSPHGHKIIIQINRDENFDQSLDLRKILHNVISKND